MSPTLSVFTVRRAHRPGRHVRQTWQQAAAGPLLLETLDRWLLPAPEPQGGHGLGISTCSANASQAGLICCNFNSCPRVSSVGQQLSTSPALSYTCFQLSPWSHSCPNVYMKASADLNRQEKQSFLLGWRQTNTASQVLFSKADPKHLFLPFQASFENLWGERCLLFLAECVGLEKQGSEDNWCNGVSLVCLNFSVLLLFVISTS